MKTNFAAKFNARKNGIASANVKSNSENVNLETVKGPITKTEITQEKVFAVSEMKNMINEQTKLINAISEKLNLLSIDQKAFVSHMGNINKAISEISDMSLTIANDTKHIRSQTDSIGSRFDKYFSAIKTEKTPALKTETVITKKAETKETETVTNSGNEVKDIFTIFQKHFTGNFMGSREYTKDTENVFGKLLMEIEKADFVNIQSVFKAFWDRCRKTDIGYIVAMKSVSAAAIGLEKAITEYCENSQEIETEKTPAPKAETVKTETKKALPKLNKKPETKNETTAEKAKAENDQMQVKNMFSWYQEKLTANNVTDFVSTLNVIYAENVEPENYGSTTDMIFDWLSDSYTSLKRSDVYAFVKYWGENKNACKSYCMKNKLID